MPCAMRTCGVKPYGLFTGQEWRALVRAARADESIRRAVERAYGDLDAAGQAEEMVAEFYADWAADRAKYPPGPVLRGEGFMDRIANGEIGGRCGPEGGPRGGTSLTQEMRVGARDQVAAIWNGSHPDMTVVTGRLPAVFRALTGKDNQLVISSNVIRKAGSHGLTLDDVVAAIEGLDNPVMVFDSTNETGNLTALVEGSAQDGRPPVAAIDAHYRAGMIEVSRIATIHGKNNADAVMGWIRGGYLRYLNKQKAGSWPRSIGRQLPKDMETSHRLGKKILQHRDVFKTEDSRDSSKDQRDLSGLKSALSRSKGGVLGMLGNLDWKRTPKEAGELFSNFLTDAMGRNARFNILSLVPGQCKPCISPVSRPCRSS